MSQSKIGSFIESWANIFIGWAVAVASQVLIFPLYGINCPLETNIKISLWFTAISLIRSYTIRRIFNRLH